MHSKQLELQKFFPIHTESQIKEEIQRFNVTYKSIKKYVNNKIEDIISEDKLLINTIESKKENEVIERLRKAYPGYNKNLIMTIKKIIDSTTKEQELGEVVNELLSQKSSFALIKPGYLDQWRNLNEFIKTAKSIWVLDEKIETFDDLTNKYKDKKNNPSVYNYEENYKDWLWKKLLLSKEEINSFSKEKIEAKMATYITLAKDHIKQVLWNIKSKNKKNLISTGFEEIHKQTSFFELFKSYYQLEIERKKTIKKEKYENQEDHLNQIRMWQYEIQRIFALTNLYMSREYNLTFQNAKEEQDLLISKLADLGSSERKEKYLDSEIKNDNPLYNYTINEDKYWNKDSETNKYIFSNNELKWNKQIVFSTFQIEWKYRNYDSKKQIIDILHVGTRIRKNAFSSAEKILRKSLSSYNEILDHKWFIFVINNYDEDLKKLLRILESELWSHKTSWLEETESMQTAWNENTNSEYKSMKWILKVSYKWKLIKEFFWLLWNIIESKQIKQFKNELDWLKKKWIDNSNIWQYKHLIEQIDNPQVQKYYKDLKEKFWEKKYSMEVEIQIFDKQNYMKAEIDENSTAYHWKYKSTQWMETLPIYFPTEIYWDAIKKVLMEELPKTERYKYLN